MSTKATAGQGSPGGTYRIDRRMWVRYACNPETSCQLLDPAGAGTWQAQVRDISARGVSLVLPHRFDQGTILAIELENAHQRFLRRVFVRVSNVRECPEGGWLHGGSFGYELDNEELLAFV